MAFDDGRYDLINGQTDYTVAFGAVFGSAPDVVVAAVENSVDDPIVTIVPTITNRTTTTFDVNLSAAPDSDDYKLVWFAGSAEVIFEVVTQYQRRMTQMPKSGTVPSANDLIPFVRMSPVPKTEVLPWRLIEQYFTRYKAEPPTSPTDPGDPGQWAMDANYVFFHNGVQWGRFPVQYVNSWDDDFTFNETRKGETALPQTATMAVVFATAFPPGNLPTPKALVVSNTTGGDTLYIGHQLTALSIEGFTLAFTGIPDSDDYNLTFEFEQESA